MKGQVISRFVKCAALIAATAVLQVNAQIVNLTHNNSVVQVDTASQSGMFNWTVDGVDVLAQQWFWFRIGGAGGEAAINTISAPTITTPNARTLTTSYFNGSYGVDITYVLTGQSGGSGLSSINESIRITNATASSLDFHFFQYSDFDLSGNDSVALGKDSFGRFNEALQTASGGVRLAETVTTPGAQHGQASLFPTILNALNDAVPTTLNDVANAGPGDATWALQWDFTLAPGGSFGISKLKDLQVPEPATGALIVAGLVAMAWRKRRQDEI